MFLLVLVLLFTLADSDSNNYCGLDKKRTKIHEEFRKKLGEDVVVNCTLIYKARGNITLEVDDYKYVNSSYLPEIWPSALKWRISIKNLPLGKIQKQNFKSFGCAWYFGEVDRIVFRQIAQQVTVTCVFRKDGGRQPR